MYQHEPEKALPYFKKALAITERMGRDADISTILFNISKVFEKLKNLTKHRVITRERSKAVVSCHFRVIQPFYENFEVFTLYSAELHPFSR